MDNIYQTRKDKLADFYKENKRVPSYSEMMKLFSLKSKDSIFKIVSKFIQDGLVQKDSQGKLAPKSILIGIRLLGTVEAGFPSPAEEALGDTITLDDYLITKKEATFLLKVSGESMINAGINPDDYVVVEKGRDARTGDIVIAEVDDGWTMKRLAKEDGRVVLLPENPKFSPIYPENELNIGGVVIGVVRKYV